MLDSFNIAATGMQAQQTQLDVVANNITNSNTAGYKKSRIDFEDLLYRQTAAASGLLATPDIKNPVGAGVGVNSVSKVFSQGDLITTERPFDIAIQGDGFLELLLPDGSYAYTRAGSLSVNSDGMIVNRDGFLLSPMIQLPDDTKSVAIEADGRVLVELPNESKLFEAGKIELARFINTSGLTPVGDNNFVPSDASGDAMYGEPGKDEFGLIAQGFLESSNVDPVEELTNLIIAQRGYGLNSKVVQVSDEIMSIINNLRR